MSSTRTVGPWSIASCARRRTRPHGVASGRWRARQSHCSRPGSHSQESFPLAQTLSDSGPGWARERCAQIRAETPDQRPSDPTRSGNDHPPQAGPCHPLEYPHHGDREKLDVFAIGGTLALGNLEIGAKDTSIASIGRPLLVPIKLAGLDIEHDTYAPFLTVLTM